MIDKERLQNAINHPLWRSHKIGDNYTMDGKPTLWKIAYYPIFEDGHTGRVYNEPRALMETPMENGTDFREIPLRYLTKICITVKTRANKEKECTQ